jgi:putative FmdB family regulatory protein
MPIYEYRCRQCEEVFGHLFRTLREAEEGEAPPCPACGTGGAQRLISRVAVVGGESEETATESKPQLFGHKELQKALEKRGY